MGRHVAENQPAVSCKELVDHICFSQQDQDLRKTRMRFVHLITMCSTFFFVYLGRSLFNFLFPMLMLLLLRSMLF